MYGWFERRVDPYPESVPAALPEGFFAFLWTCSAGMRGYLLLMTLCTALIGVFEAGLFAVLGRIVEKQNTLSDELGRDAGSVSALQRKHQNFIQVRLLPSNTVLCSFKFILINVFFIRFKGL